VTHEFPAIGLVSRLGDCAPFVIGLRFVVEGRFVE
jgi:hypothetical protein